MFNQYQPNLDNMQQYLNQENDRSNYSNDGPNWFSFPKGMCSIRILPPWDPTGRVALPVYSHPIEFQGANMKYKKWSWTCANKTLGKPCQICEGLASLSASGVDVSEWEANRRQFYFNAIVMHDPTFNNADKGTAPGTHVLLKAPKTFYDWVISQITNPMIGDITSVTNGIDIYVTKDGEGLGTSYNMTLSPNGRTPVPQEYLDKITDLYNLDEVFGSGFEQEQINELTEHLKRSAGAMGGAVSGMQQQMAGYTVPQQTNAPSWQNQTTGYPPMNNPVTNTTNVGVPQAPSPFQQNPSPVGSVPTPPAPVTPAPAPSANMPKCFGQYDSGNVNCVVCPVEMDCAKSKNG